MNQFVALCGKELGFWFRRPGVHLFAALYVFWGVMMMLAMAGDIEFIRVGGMGGLVKADSPNQVLLITLGFSLIPTLNIAAASGGAATRDITDGMHPLVYSTPVPRLTFLLSRYFGALVVSTYIVAAIPAGMLLGRLLPLLEPERIGAFAPLTTIALLVAWIGPNILMLSALFFGIGALTRRMFPIYIGGVFVLVGYLGAGAFLRDLDNRTIGVMLDAFGTTAVGEMVRYWTPIERNTLVPWPSGMALVNRIVWTSIGLGVLSAALWLTRLDHTGWQPFARFQRPDRADAPEGFDATIAVPKATRRFDGRARIVQLVALTRKAVGDVIGHRYFWAFVGAAVLFELLNSQAIGTMFGTDTWPVTYQVLLVFEGTLGLFTLIILAFYAGDLVWTERDLGSDQLIDSAPLPDWLPLIAKTIALSAVIVGLHTTILLMGPLVQLFNGYTHFELGQYVQTLYALSLLDWLPFVALGIAAHAIANNKLVGHGLMVGFWAATIFRSQLGFEHNLFWLGADTGRTYSDMNGWGHSLGPFLTYKAYWMAVSVVLVVIARLAWVRGTDGRLAARLTEARRRLDPVTTGLLAGSVALSAGFAGWIAWQTNGVHGYETTSQALRDRATYERRYKAEWEGANQPLVTAVDATVDLYPEDGRAHVKATLSLTNAGDTPIERVMIAFPEERHVVDATLSVPVTETRDDALEVRIWTLERPLAPGADATLAIDVDYRPLGMANSGFETTVVPNGTFLHHNEVFPQFGYARGYEIADPAERRKQDLPERDRMYDLDDPRARDFNYITDDGHRVALRTRISTVAGQIPLAPGNEVARGEEDGRVWREYVVDEPIWYFLAWLSGEWEVARSEDGPIPVEVYFHPDHTYNVDRMLEGMVKSLQVFERDFGPYQHDILRIVEFPRYQTYAQSFPTLVPFSEAIGFIARLSDPDEDIDYPYYVTAHEVAHQWWAHQVCGGDGQGATVLTESMSQYGALAVMEAEYGPDQIDRFLEYEADSYFRARSNERDEELPLMRVENQGYIHYQKGGIVLYALAQRVGPERFDAAVREFVDEWRFVGPPFPTARDFVEHLKARLPEHTDAIRDAFERIVLYDLRAERATATRSGSGWTVRIEGTARKLVADGEGRETEEPFRDTVAVSIEDDTGAKHVERVEVGSDGPIELELTGLKGAPTSVELDPRALFLERNHDDNTVDVEVVES